ncbi:MAG: T9SS type A sorting domain-containing protein [Bacteroidota bacterium]
MTKLYDFSSNLTTVCVGDPVQFSDESYNLVNSWSWSFPGGTPSSASSQNPLVTYNTPGLYNVTLDASDGGTNDSEVKNNYIRVLLAPTTIPFYEGFENYNTLNNLMNWEIYNPDGNNAFDIEHTTSFNGTKCAKLQNFGQAAGSLDELITTPIDLSGLTANQTITLSFRYAYRKKLAADNEALKVFITGDCGDTWVQRKTITNNQLSSQAVATSWKPSSQADWVTVHMTNITSTYFQQNFRAKWRFEGNGGNNFYLDDINLYNGAPSNTVVLGMETLEENVSEVVLYPNPVSSELNVEYTATTADKMTVVLLDANGKQVQAHEIHSNAGKNVVMMDTHALAAGKYSAVIYGPQGQVSRTFIKQ